MNLLPISAIQTQTKNGVTLTNNQDGTYTIKGTNTTNSELEFTLFDEENINLEIGDNFAFSYYGLVEGIKANVWYADWSIVGQNGDYTNTTISKTGAITKECSIIAKLFIQANATVDTIIKPKIEKGTVATPYSPYGQGCASVMVGNKNWIESSTWQHGAIDSNGVAVAGTWNYRSPYYKVNPNTTYIFSLNKNISEIFYYEYNSKKEFIQRHSNFTTSTAIITTSSETEYIKVNLGYGQTFTQEIFDTYVIQLEKGTTTPTSYTPHEHQTYTIPVQQPMRSIGNVRDKFVRVNGSWFERHVFDKYIFTGGDEENWGAWDSSLEGKYRPHTPIIMDLVKKPSNPQSKINMLCNYFINGSADDTVAGTTRIAITVTGQVTMYSKEFNNENCVEQLKAWLSNKILYIIYELATPTDLPCTAEQTAILEEIYNQAKTYKDGTHIYSTDETSPYFEVEYFIDLQSLVTRIEKLEVEG